MILSFEDNQEAYSFLHYKIDNENEEYVKDKDFYWPNKNTDEIEGEEIQLCLSSDEINYKKDCLKVIQDEINKSIQLEFPEGNYPDEISGLNTILLHYYSEGQILRIKELISIYQETETLPKMEDEQFIIIVAIAHLFSIFMIDNFKEIFDSTDHYGYIYM